MNLFEQGLSLYLTREQRQKIIPVKIGIGGVGGLGSNLAGILVRCGFRHFEILDHDIIEPSNLNRQFYFIDEIGQPKVHVLRKRLLKINPDIDIILHRVRWSEKTADQYFPNCSIIAEAFDQAIWKRTFVEFYQSKTKTVVSGVGMAGLCTQKDIAVKKMGNVYFVGDLTTDTAQGHPPMAPRVTICAATMADVILKLTLQ